MIRLLRFILLLLGLVCIAIGTVHVLFGPASIPGGVVTNAVMDSEDRFYATLFIGFGGAMAWCARDPVSRRKMLGALLLVFFGGGIARLISLAAVGPPSPLFLFLGSLELLMPPLLWWWLRQTSERPVKRQ